MLRWLTSNEVFNIKDEIEEVSRKMLEKLLEDNDFVAVYFCKSFLCSWAKLNIFFELADENDCYDCEAILNELEHIDDDTDELDIMYVIWFKQTHGLFVCFQTRFVKIRDTKYARKYGINDVPALVFFRKKFPSIYRGKCSFGWDHHFGYWQQYKSNSGISL